MTLDDPDNLSLLDHEWVGGKTACFSSCLCFQCSCCRVGWLGEIGLPQYRGSFLEARVDGHVLNSLTIVSFHASCCY